MDAWTFLKTADKFCILIQISQKFVCDGPIDKPLFKPMTNYYQLDHSY